MVSEGQAGTVAREVRRGGPSNGAKPGIFSTHLILSTRDAQKETVLGPHAAFVHSWQASILSYPICPQHSLCVVIVPVVCKCRPFTLLRPRPRDESGTLCFRIINL